MQGFILWPKTKSFDSRSLLSTYQKHGDIQVCQTHFIFLNILEAFFNVEASNCGRFQLELKWAQKIEKITCF